LIASECFLLGARQLKIITTWLLSCTEIA